jgi:gamma-glutamyltranspeptidase / glutathione hydrolase / leukotriene-C4 hydrolase
MFKKILEENPNLASIYAPNGKLLGEGDLLKRTNFSKTLELIAENGSEVFYRVILFKDFIKCP